MHFFVDHDSGSSISGWVVPDNPGEVPNFVVRVPGRPDVAMPANVLRTDLRDLGLHSTGLAGFNIDDQYIGGLAEIADVTILDASSGIPIYRRPDPNQHLDKKLLLLDVAIFPQIRIIRRVMASFALAYPVVDRLPIETITAVIVNKAATSIFVAGQPNWSRHGSLAREKNYITAALLRDPFEDLAERLLFIAHLAKRSNRNAFNSSLEKYEPVLEFISEMDFADRKSVLTGFRKMAPEYRRLFRSPMTTVFGGAPESELQRRNVSVALDSLAQIDIVGVRPLYDDFASMLDAALAKRILSGSQLEMLPGTLELAANLAELGLVADLLDEDIALYSFACEAVEAGLKTAYDHRRSVPSGQSRENM
jgi:hypothetical protein